jgi:hypothetical protein
MKKYPGGLAAIGVLALCLLAPSGAAALEAPIAVRPTWGVAVEGLLDPALAGQVSRPSINFNLGAGVVMPFSAGSRFSFEPSADLYWANYEYLNGAAVPTDETFGSAFGLGLLLDAPVVYTIPLAKGFSLGFGMGLCFDIRAAFTLDSTYKPEDTAPMNSYFWDKARFLMPSTILRAEYALTERVGFGLSGRILWPLYNLWSGMGVGFFDRAKYLVDLSIVYKLGKPAG